MCRYLYYQFLEEKNQNVNPILVQVTSLSWKAPLTGVQVTSYFELDFIPLKSNIEKLWNQSYLTRELLGSVEK